MIASPYARKLAREGGVDVGLATGSGPNGRIVAADVQQLIQSGTHGTSICDSTEYSNSS